MIAVKRGHLELVRYLLQYSVVKSSVPMVNKVCHLVSQAAPFYRERKGMVSLQTLSCHHSRKLL